MKSSTQDKAEGKWHKVKGKIKQVAGKAIGNRDLESEGEAENVDGKVSRKDRSSQKACRQVARCTMRRHPVSQVAAHVSRRRFFGG